MTSEGRGVAAWALLAPLTLCAALVAAVVTWAGARAS